MKFFTFSQCSKMSRNTTIFLLKELEIFPTCCTITSQKSVLLRPGSVLCTGLQQPYGAGALQTSYYRSYITGLTAAILRCFHFSHECSCAGEQLRSAMFTRRELEDGHQGNAVHPGVFNVTESGFILSLTVLF